MAFSMAFCCLVFRGDPGFANFRSDFYFGSYYISKAFRWGWFFMFFWGFLSKSRGWDVYFIIYFSWLKVAGIICFCLLGMVVASCFLCFILVVYRKSAQA